MYFSLINDYYIVNVWEFHNIKYICFEQRDMFWT